MNYRTLKFRVWNNKTKSWIHSPHKNPSLDGVNLFGETILLGGFMDGVSIQDLNDCIAFQYTGLHDKHGVEIFEGDIVRTELVSLFSKRVYEVKYHENRFVPDDITYSNSIEVIGNICETPELVNNLLL